MSKFQLKLGINQATNLQYHSDKAWLSSSSYKDLLKDPAKFYKEHVLGQREEQAQKDHFTTGSLLHSLVLEPHLVASEYAVFEGLRRAGSKFEEFKANVKSGVTIVTSGQMQQAKWLLNGYKQNKVARQLIDSGGLSEHTVCQIWYDVPTKVRADRINIEKGYIVDVKTSSFPLDPDSAKMTIDKWNYTLSAALYADVMAQYYGKPFDFYWLFCGKVDGDCAVYKMSESTRQQGLLQCIKGATLYKECMRTGKWETPEKITHFDEEIIEI